MARGDFESSWAEYQRAVAALYEQPVADMVDAAEGDVPRATDLEDRAQAVLDRSEELGQTAADNLASADDPAQRELAELQLLAAAAFDLAVANDLVRRDAAVPDEVAERPPMLPGAVAELKAILDAPPSGGMPSLMEDALVIDLSALPSDPQASKQALKGAASKAVTDIRDDAASGGETAFQGIVGIGTAPLQQATKVAIDGLLAALPEGISGLVRRAARLVVQAIDKVLKLLGEDAQDAAREKVAGWIENLQQGTLFETLLDKLYETDRIQEEVNGLVDGASDTLDPDSYNTASQQVSELAGGFRKQRRVVSWVVRGLTFASGWVLPLVAWGPASSRGRLRGGHRLLRLRRRRLRRLVPHRLVRAAGLCPGRPFRGTRSSRLEAVMNSSAG